MQSKPLIVSFEKADPTQIDKLGAKGAKLAEDFQKARELFPGADDIISVPDGFILSSEVWRAYRDAGDRLPDDVFAQINQELTDLGTRVGRTFGDCSGRMPLIVAVRGGAAISLPGAISTILNVGLNDEVVAALIAAGEDEGFVLNTYLTAIRIFGEVVLGIQYDHFYDILMHFKVGDEGSIEVPLINRLILSYKKLLRETGDRRFEDAFQKDLSLQLRYAIEAVLASWMAPTAVEARRSRESEEGGVSDDMGTAVTIQSMVFGNRDEANSLSGVLFTRNQRTGADFPVIEWAPKVQCDKIVSGKLRKHLRDTLDLKDEFPDIYDHLLMVREAFENLAKRPLDIEFTVENRKLYILQRRPLRMTFHATVRSMWDFVDEGKTIIQRASMIINKALEQKEKVLKDGFHDYEILARGEPITDSADNGILAFGTEEALILAEQGKDVILFRKRPYGETDVAVNHPRVRGVVRCDGNTTGHEAVSAVAYSKPYLINLVDAKGQPLIISRNGKLEVNPESALYNYLGKQVFVDCERGILAYTQAVDFLEDRKGRKKLYVDWEFVREQFEQGNHQELDYESLLDLHYQWELELSRYQWLEKHLREKKGKDTPISQQELLNAFSTYLSYLPERDRHRALHLKDVNVEDFDFGPPLVYRGKDLRKEVMKILRTLMLCTTWRTHWVHELMVIEARRRGESENDVIRDIFLKNRTMSLVQGFEEEGFHVMQVPDHYFLILASNFEYGQDLDKVDIGPEALNYAEKENLARQFLSYLEEINPAIHQKVRIVQGEPPLGEGHARIISIGISIPNGDFDLVCRYLRSFLDKRHAVDLSELQNKIPMNDFMELYHLDPFFARYPEFSITRRSVDSNVEEDYFLTFGGCSFGEFNGQVYGQEDYERLMSEVRRFQGHLRARGKDTSIRPWQFEVDPYRRHSVIAAVGIRFDKKDLGHIMEDLKEFLTDPGAKRSD
ncbi:PEP/pyruvate-binding domain-containing protein [Desulfoferrobacter suflitae]|uniref:PEP/pyruvate-binding domain-containing protein n=1 Tax=Desulfoferrobacter suflitae TaxID=2865782 RepID=UPI00216409D6|nr:PEP/pyruvate-binding domain-containing protein [Desulfoferrobacter suflitae]MCK8600751.1 hypothetical protein [Desulfoferrobacter suflitae]